MRYTKGMNTRTRLTTDQKLHALALIARGETLTAVVGYLKKDYDVTVSLAAISQLKKSQGAAIARMTEKMEEDQVIEAEQLLKRSRVLLSKRLDKAERDQRELEEVDRQWRNGEIRKREAYSRKKAGLLKVSIAELVQISKSMHDQTKKEPETPPANPLAPGNTNPAQLEALVEALRNNNTVELQRIVFNPKAAI